MNKTAKQQANQSYRPMRTSVDLSGGAITALRLVPPPDLQPYVMEFWEYKVSPNYSHVPVQVFPNGCLSIRFNIKPSGVEPVLYGPSVLNNMTGLFYHDWTIFGVALWPAYSYQLLGLSLDELRDLRVHLDCIWPQQTRWLCEKLQAAADMPARIDVLSQFLRSKLQSQSPPKADFLNAYAALVKTAPSASDIDMVAKRSGTSARSLRRHFHKYLGIGPKQMHRLVKVQRSLKTIARHPALSLAQLSASSGFSDQAHFSRSFQEFVGMSPSRFASLVGTMHSDDLDIWAGLDPKCKDLTPPKILRFKPAGA